MPLVLGIDAAWTEGGSSGVALLRAAGCERAVVAVAPSYASLIELANGKSVDWRTPATGVPDVPELLSAAAALGGQPVDVIAIDMPISRRLITGRRPADQAVSRAFGKFGAAVHSPSAKRPDAAVTGMVKRFEAAGFSIATMTTALPALIEVYPLAALVQLPAVAKRPAYKVSRMARYGWPKSFDDRRQRLREAWNSITGALEREVGPLGINFPMEPSSASQLKPYEDALDAIIAAWVGSCFLSGTATAYPDDDPDAAIWIPERPVRGSLC